MVKPKSRAIYAINGVEISEDEFKKQVGADNFSIMFEDALAAYKDVGGQSVYTIGSLSQKRKLNGSVESISLNSPMSWARLRDLTPTLQFLYLDHLVNEHKARRVDLLSMLGIATCTFYKLQQKLPGKLIFSGKPQKPAPEWTRFMEAGYQDVPATGNDAPLEATPAQEQPPVVVSPPAVLAGSVTVRCTASHVLDALMRLVDDPEREYTFTVSFES